MSDYFPESVVEQILLKLPHTTLVRFTSVSKSWRSLIASPTFTLKHSLSNPTPPLLLTRHSSHWSLFNLSHFPSPTITHLEPPYPNHHYPSSFRFIQSLHGLVCLVEKIDGIVHAVILWNPSVRRHVRIEAPALRHTAAVGFGFDSKDCDFKVIRIVNSLRVELYSLNQGSWRVVDVRHTRGLDLSGRFSDTPHFLNGNVHWMVCDGDIYADDDKSILVFNVEQETFKKFELPPKLVEAWFINMKLTVINGCLSVLNCKDGSDRCKIWMMREHGVADSWIKMYSFSIVGGSGPSNVFGLSTGAKVLVLKEDPEESDGERAYFSLHSFTRRSEGISFFNIEGGVISVCEYTPGSLVLLDKA